MPSSQYQLSRVRGPTLFLIFDGWGMRREKDGNPLAVAKTPTLAACKRRYPSTILFAHGTHVGLTFDQDGNSEAGHLNLGAGRIVEQDSLYISRRISDGTFFRNSSFLQAVRHAKRHRSSIHIMGLLSGPESGHADPDHLIALLTLLRGQKVPQVFLHFFTDGRDSGRFMAVELLKRFEAILEPNEQIATILGRFYAMDRKKEWSRTQKAFSALVVGASLQAPSASAAIVQAYNRGESDEYVSPTVIATKKYPSSATRIRNADSVIFFNLRSDRARQLTKMFVQERFQELNPGSFRLLRRPKGILFVALTDFGPDLGDVLTAFPSRDIPDTLPFILKPLHQLYLTESEKFAQVTYFFNGGYDHPVAGEERLMVPSPSVRSYDATPAMSGEKLTAVALNRIRRRVNDIIVMNYPNLDMIGHTGNFKAAVRAIEFLDGELKKLVAATLQRDGIVFLTGDHGNIEHMVERGSGEVNTTHSKNPVPFLVIGKRLPSRRLRRGILADVAPTLLTALGIPQPQTMTGRSLWQ